MDQDLPDILYKYRRWDDKYPYDKASLLENKIYFASAEQFNDPFDCKVPIIDFSKITDQQAKNAIKRITKEKYPSLNRGERRRKERQVYKQGLWKNPQEIRRQAELYQREKYEKGILSLTLNPTNILMWSHYADSHRGYCIGYDTKRLKNFLEIEVYNKEKLIISPYHIEYSHNDEYPTFGFYEVNNGDLFKLPLTTKSKHWSYEQEIRYICMEKAKFPLTLPDNVIV